MLVPSLLLQPIPSNGDLIVPYAALVILGVVLGPLLTAIGVLFWEVMKSKDRALEEMTEDRNFWRDEKLEDLGLAEDAVRTAKTLSLRERRRRSPK